MSTRERRAPRSKPAQSPPAPPPRGRGKAPLQLAVRAPAAAPSAPPRASPLGAPAASGAEAQPPLLAAATAEPVPVPRQAALEFGLEAAWPVAPALLEPSFASAAPPGLNLGAYAVGGSQQPQARPTAAAGGTCPLMTDNSAPPSSRAAALGVAGAAAVERWHRELGRRSAAGEERWRRCPAQFLWPLTSLYRLACRRPTAFRRIQRITRRALANRSLPLVAMPRRHGALCAALVSRADMHAPPRQFDAIFANPHAMVAAGEDPVDDAAAAAADAAADGRGDALATAATQKRKRRTKEEMAAAHAEKEAARAAKAAAREARGKGQAGEKAARKSAAGDGPSGAPNWTMEEMEALVEAYKLTIALNKPVKGREFVERLVIELRQQNVVREPGAFGR
jgi:hypothetical protein